MAKLNTLTEGEKQNVLRDFVGREVGVCMSGMIHYLFTEKKVEDYEFQDAMMGYDHEEELIRYMDNASEQEVTDLATDMAIEFDDDVDIEQIKTDIRKAFNALSIGERGDIILNNLDIDPEYREIFEYWTVTGWFADKLLALGEAVIKDWNGLHIWGRATTGQAIYMDYVIEKIYTQYIDN